MKTENRTEIGAASAGAASSAIFWHNSDCVFIEQIEEAKPPKEGHRHLVLLNREEVLQVIKVLRRFTDLEKPTDWFERVRLSLGGAVLGMMATTILAEWALYSTPHLAQIETIGGVAGFVAAFIWLSKNPT